MGRIPNNATTRAVYAERNSMLVAMRHEIAQTVSTVAQGCEVPPSEISCFSWSGDGVGARCYLRCERWGTVPSEVQQADGVGLTEEIALMNLAMNVGVLIEQWRGWFNTSTRAVGEKAG